jgi:hypothetical protein
MSRFIEQSAQECYSAKVRIKAIVLSYDRNRALTEHMIRQYARVWPSHPFVFHVPFQELRGEESERTHYVQTPAPIKATVMKLIVDLADEEWIYWCMDDRYPIQLVTDKIERMISQALTSDKMDGLLFCRCRSLLLKPKQTLYQREHVDADGTVYFQRRGWRQIWIHQLMRVKVLRHLFTHLPDELPNANAMDKLKHDVPMPKEFRLFVTKENYAVFGESTRRGRITQNCYDSMIASGIEVPEWFRATTGEEVLLGTL